LAKLLACPLEEHTMIVIRLLFWIALIGAAIWFWRRLRTPAPVAPKGDDNPAPMVRCAHCGVHVPRAHALPQGEHWYCSQPHLQQGPSPR
jgi:uncharacterized protein